jgi:glutathione synthase/RimK-type ligase-like ATP-grasp enzyme
VILIIAEHQDIHALAVVKALFDFDHTAQVAIFDSSDFPLKAQLELNPSSWALRDNNGRRFSSDDVTAVWWRRALPHHVSDTIVDPPARRFVANECSHAFNCIAAWPGYLVVNNIEKERLASLKPLQLNIAQSAGLRVPDTLITNDPRGAEAFCAAHDQAIFKTLTAPISTFGETRRYKSEHKHKLSSLVHAPVIFQEEIKRRRDLRVTVVGNEIFPAEIQLNNPVARDYPDWRLDGAAECQECELPADVLEGIKRLVAALGLSYGAIDLIETDNGDHVFLEINPSGQFLFVEIDTHQQISKAIAKLLLQRQ